MEHDCLKALYVAFLDTFPPRSILEFWSRFPLSLPGEGAVSERRKFEFLWGESGRMPWSYYWRVCGALEGFLNGQGVEAERFLDKLPWRVEGASIYPGRKLLEHMTPDLPGLYLGNDPHRTILDVVSRLARDYLPGADVRAIACGSGGGMGGAYLLCDPGGLKRILGSGDFHLWAQALIRRAPETLGSQAFGGAEILSDCRSVGAALGEPPDIRDGVLFLRSEPHGVTRTFRAFCGERGLAGIGAAYPDRVGILMGRDYRCPKRRRTVLFRGCFYGAPAYLSLLRQAGAPMPENPFARIIEDIRAEEGFASGRLASLHGRVMEMAGKARFLYQEASETLFLNGVLFARGMPARIMRKTLKAFVTEGRRQYRFQEFKQDGFVHPHPGACYLELSLKRLAEGFRRKFPALGITFPGRGGFALRTGCEVEYREVEA